MWNPVFSLTNSSLSFLSPSSSLGLMCRFPSLIYLEFASTFSSFIQAWMSLHWWLLSCINGGALSSLFLFPSSRGCLLLLFCRQFRLHLFASVFISIGLILVRFTVASLFSCELLLNSSIVIFPSVCFCMFPSSNFNYLFSACKVSIIPFSFL